MIQGARLIVVTMLVLARAAGAAPNAAREDEFIRVAPDAWTFQGAETQARFIPLGSNYVLTDKEDLNVFGPQYTPERHIRILDACASLNINLLKVFLPIAQVLPDPQTPGEVHIAPGYLDRLENFLTLCRERHIRVVVALTSWGGNGIKWWHEGGQYFGRIPWKQEPGIDSLDVLQRFWKEIAGRFQNNPTIFAYTPAVEWTFPASNLTWIPPHGHSATLPSEPGQWYWRAWLAAKYKTLEALNAAWGKDAAAFDQVALPDYGYDGGAHAYKDSEQAIFDYQNFREWATLRYMQPQIAAIRAADSKHMVTISNHMRFWDLWEGAADQFLGTTPFEQKDLLDYMTVHGNFHENEDSAERNDAFILRQVQVLARFVSAGRPMPVILEEFTYSSRTPERVAEVQGKILRGTIGYISGWTTWYLQYPQAPADSADSTDKEARSGWLKEDLAPTPWGLAARGIWNELTAANLAWIAPKTTVVLDRRKELVPKTLGTVATDYRTDDTARFPIDYQIAPEPDARLVLP